MRAKDSGITEMFHSNEVSQKSPCANIVDNKISFSKCIANKPFRERFK